MAGPLRATGTGAASGRSVSSEATSSNRCAHAPSCVPCPFRGLPIREQLQRKRESVRQALATIAGLEQLDVEPTVGSRDLFGYRAITKLVIRSGRNGALQAGVYLPGTHNFADAVACEVQPSPVNEIIGRFLHAAADAGITAYDEDNRTGELRYIIARWAPGTRRILLIIVTRSRNVPGLRNVTQKLVKRAHLLGGILQNVNPTAGNVILGREWATLRPPAGIIDRFGPFQLHWSPGSFAQANSWIARRIAETVLEWSAPRPEERVADLYCGVGPLSLFLASEAREVVGIEEVPSAVNDARSNARRNGIHNARFVEQAVDGQFPAVTGPVDLLVLNPPRKGSTIEVIAAISEVSPRRIIYVSCNPTTLVRDLGRLKEHGFQVSRIRPFDMMPQTAHVEVVAQLDRQE